MSAPSYAALYDVHDVYARFPSEHRQAGSLPIDFTRVRQGDFEATDPATREFALCVGVGPHVGTLEVDFGEGNHTFGHTGAAFYLNPTNGDATFRQSGQIDLLFVSASMADIARRLEMEDTALWNALRPHHDRMGKDLAVRSQMLGLWAAASRNGAFASLAVDHGLLALVAGLIDRARPDARLLPTPPPQLDDARLARVVDYVEAHLGEPIQLDDLGRVACYSIFHFSRAFKDATGVSPQRYVTTRRVERAKALMRGPMPLAQIAHACGFASQSHFGEVFKAHVGATPGAWRAAL